VTPCPPRSSSLPLLSLLPRLDLSFDNFVVSPCAVRFLFSPRGLTTDMSDTLYGYSQSNDPKTVSIVLEDGTLFTVIDTYSKAQSRAVIVRGCPFSYPHSCAYHPQALIVASCVSLVATVGLLAAIAVRSNLILYLPRLNVAQDVCVQYAHYQEPKHVCANACSFLFCLATPQ